MSESSIYRILNVSINTLIAIYEKLLLRKLKDLNRSRTLSATGY